MIVRFIQSEHTPCLTVGNLYEVIETLHSSFPEGYTAYRIKNDEGDVSIYPPDIFEKVADTPNWNGMQAVPATHEYKFESPFYFDGISYDEYFVEQCYHHACIARSKMIGYKPLRKQIIDGDIQSIPDEFKISLPYPGNCTAYANLLNAQTKLQNRSQAILAAERGHKHNRRTE